MDFSLLQSVDFRFIIVPALAIMGLVGLLAILSPRHFAAVSQASSRWVDTRPFWEMLDKRVNVDQVALRYCRFFGLLVVASAVWLLWVYWTQILGMPLGF